MLDCKVGVLLEIPDKKLIQSDYGRESTLVENLRFLDIVMDYTPLAIKINLFDGDDTAINGIRSLYFENFTAKCEDAILINGTPSAPVENVRFTSCSFLSSSPNPIKINHAKNVIFDDEKLSTL
jgi:hypothetical protein